MRARRGPVMLGALPLFLRRRVSMSADAFVVNTLANAQWAMPPIGT
jgi:hypothetical protein